MCVCVCVCVCVSMWKSVGLRRPQAGWHGTEWEASPPSTVVFTSYQLPFLTDTEHGRPTGEVVVDGQWSCSARCWELWLLWRRELPPRWQSCGNYVLFNFLELFWSLCSVWLYDVCVLQWLVCFRVTNYRVLKLLVLWFGLFTFFFSLWPPVTSST